MIHKLDPQLLERPIRTLVVGCGGNGSAVLSGLPYLHQALLAFEHPGGLAVTAIDPDVVSETNCVRQPFCRTEIGLPKATVLVHRINSFWGLNWQGMQAEIQQIAKGEVDVVVGCVDTRKARRAIDAWVRKSRVRYWLDLGNSASTGQFVLGQPNNALNRKGKNRLPTVAELYPEILARDDKHDQQPACSAAEALTRQEPFINQNLAYQALAMLTQLVRHGSLSFQGGFCNVEIGHVVPLSISGRSRSTRTPVTRRHPLEVPSVRVDVLSRPASLEHRGTNWRSWH
jgi:PRTRC genetic system ThiF family protein